MMLLRALLAIVAGTGAGASLAVAQTDCPTVDDCRVLAIEAAGREEHEAFHDLAWRAVQLGSPRDPDLMYLLARAQSLSGRPGDALVMLRRLAEAGVWTDAGTNDDFRRIRALPGWPALAGLIAGLAAEPAPAGALAAPAGTVLPIPAARTRAAESAAPGLAPPPASPAGPFLPAVEEAGRLPGGSFDAGSLTYDAVSARFIIGSRRNRKLVVVSDDPGRIEDLVRAESAGFLDVMAIEIDAQRGDLWVVTAEEDGGSGDERRSTALHRVQLISGRPIAMFGVEEGHLPARFVDVAVTRGGDALALDEAGGRIFRLRRGADRLEVVATLDVIPASVAATAGERVVYVAHFGGIRRVDINSQDIRAVEPLEGLDLGGFDRLRWHRGSLVGVQSDGDGRRSVVRLRLDSTGRRALRRDVLDTMEAAGDATTSGLSGDDFYYAAGAGVDGRTIRRIRLTSGDQP